MSISLCIAIGLQSSLPMGNRVLVTLGPPKKDALEALSQTDPSKFEREFSKLGGTVVNLPNAKAVVIGDPHGLKSWRMTTEVLEWISASIDFNKPVGDAKNMPDAVREKFVDWAGGLNAFGYPSRNELATCKFGVRMVTALRYSDQAVSFPALAIWTDPPYEDDRAVPPEFRLQMRKKPDDVQDSKLESTNYTYLLGNRITRLKTTKDYLEVVMNQMQLAEQSRESVLRSLADKTKVPLIPSMTAYTDLPNYMQAELKTALARGSQPDSTKFTKSRIESAKTSVSITLWLRDENGKPTASSVMLPD